ncbi:DUF3782 domain-containing protein [Vulcanisaeta distributa]|uniref:DUF3782 domain-containing protein n=1 Tax=Vulcanisaeta distributa TaxID=164451 RepID=UPI000B14B617|nr:DUF3782 domain-containing protein [Vulcanisaeta distributa]
MDLDIRKELLRLLKEDEEFRYAVMGLLGISDLKSSVDNLVKALTELKDIVARQGEEIGELRKTVELLSKSFEETRKAVEALVKSHDELKKIVETLSEDVRRHGEVIIVMQTSIEKLTSSVTALGYRYGLFTEEAFRESIKYLVSDLLKVYEVRRWTYYDSDGVVFGHPLGH